MIKSIPNHSPPREEPIEALHSDFISAIGLMQKKERTKERKKEINELDGRILNEALLIFLFICCLAIRAILPGNKREQWRAEKRKLLAHLVSQQQTRYLYLLFLLPQEGTIRLVLFSLLGLSIYLAGWMLLLRDVRKLIRCSSCLAGCG